MKNHKEWRYIKKDLLLGCSLAILGIVVAKSLDSSFIPQNIEDEYQLPAAIAGSIAAVFFQVLSFYGIARYKFIIKKELKSTSWTQQNR